MKRGLMLSALLVVTACASIPAERSAVRITAFSEGLVVLDKDGGPRIYRPGNEFTYKVNGTCIANGRQLPCMWHGFEVSFEGPDDLAVLNCTTKINRPTRVVSPTSDSESKVSTFNWTLELRGRSGRLTYPQYTILEPGSRSGKIRRTTRCYDEGHEVLNYEFTVRVPLLHTGQQHPASVHRRSRPQA